MENPDPHVDVEDYLIAQAQRMIEAVGPYVKAGRLSEAMMLMKVTDTILCTLEQRRYL